jgi:hypothetical protein
MSASVAGTGVRRLIHYSSRELVEWGVIPGMKEYNSTLVTIRHSTALKTGKPPGLWYAYEEEWLAHYKPAIGARKNLSNVNKKSQFAYKYLFEVPESAFTTNIEPDPSKILVLSLDNFKDFLVRYNAPGIRKGDRTPSATKWFEIWNGVPAEYTRDRKPLIGVKELFAGIEFSKELVEYSTEHGFKVLDKNGNKQIVVEVDFADAKGVETHSTVDVSFLQFLEIRSGCFFKPELLFPEGPAPHFVSRPNAPHASRGTARRGGRRGIKSRRITARRTRANDRSRRSANLG